MNGVLAYYSVRDIARRLGVSNDSARKLAQQLPHLKGFRKLLVPIEAFHEYEATGMVQRLPKKRRPPKLIGRSPRFKSLSR